MRWGLLGNYCRFDRTMNDLPPHIPLGGNPSAVSHFFLSVTCNPLPTQCPPLIYTEIPAAATENCSRAPEHESPAVRGPHRAPARGQPTEHDGWVGTSACGARPGGAVS